MDKQNNKKPADDQKADDTEVKPVENQQDEKCEAITKERDEFKGKYLRALADYQNFERRMAAERSNIRSATIREIVIELLPFLDHLEKAEVFIKDPGLKMIKQQYLQFLTGLGIEELDIENKPYDPLTAEVIEVVDGAKDNIVIEVLRKGYKYHDYIVRIAQVKVEKIAEKKN